MFYLYVLLRRWPLLGSKLGYLLRSWPSLGSKLGCRLRTYRLHVAVNLSIFQEAGTAHPEHQSLYCLSLCDFFFFFLSLSMFFLVRLHVSWTCFSKRQTLFCSLSYIGTLFYSIYFSFVVSKRNQSSLLICFFM